MLIISITVVPHIITFIQTYLHTFQNTYQILISFDLISIIETK